MPDHPIFGKFVGYEGPVEEDIEVDWIGARFRREWWGAPKRAAIDHAVITVPFHDEEYFEWVDLLEFVDLAGSQFVMMELGAGYGRWGTRVALAARQRGKKAEVLFVEAEPQHSEWLRKSMVLNKISGYKLIEKAISYERKLVPFTISFNDLDAQSWYGQKIGWSEVAQTARVYFGREVFTDSHGYSHIFVETTTLEDIIFDVPIIDLIDVDIQGSEREFGSKLDQYLEY